MLNSRPGHPSRGSRSSAWKQPFGKGRDKWGQHERVTANFMFFDRGTFWVLPLTYSYLPKSARAYLFPQSVKFITFAAAPLVLTPFVRNQVKAAVVTRDRTRMGTPHASTRYPMGSRSHLVDALTRARWRVSQFQVSGGKGTLQSRASSLRSTTSSSTLKWKSATVCKRSCCLFQRWNKQDN